MKLRIGSHFLWSFVECRIVVFIIVPRLQKICGGSRVPGTSLTQPPQGSTTIGNTQIYCCLLMLVHLLRSTLEYYTFRLEHLENGVGIEFDLGV